MDGVVLAAAGSSERMGGGPSKVLRPLAGVPVFLRALEPFLQALPGAPVVMAVRPEDRAAVADLTLGHAGLRRVRVVAGGATRQESVTRAVAALPPEVEVVLVHDAARPLATPPLVRRVLEAARRDGAAAPALPLSDSVHEVDENGRIVRAVARATLRTVQTPQAARADLLRRALVEAERSGLRATDEVALLVAAGIPVTAVEGDPDNLKLTTPRDWRAAEAVLSRRAS